MPMMTDCSTSWQKHCDSSPSFPFSSCFFQQVWALKQVCCHAIKSLMTFTEDHSCVCALTHSHAHDTNDCFFFPFTFKMSRSNRKSLSFPQGTFLKKWVRWMWMCFMKKKKKNQRPCILKMYFSWWLCVNESLKWPHSSVWRSEKKPEQERWGLTDIICVIELQRETRMVVKLN